MSLLDNCRALFWGLFAFLALGAVFFLACVAFLADCARREWRRRAELRKRWALDPCRHGPLTWEPLRRLRR